MKQKMEESKLEIERHIRYWQRCLRTLLPTQYTSTDSSRMTLGFFILAALDLLGASADTLPPKDRENIKNWVLKCQHPNGGFCGSPNHRYPDEYHVDVGNGERLMDPANLPATFFSLLSLSFVGGFEQVKRGKCLKWLKSLQREDGSFGELLTEERKIQGGRDMRYCYVANAIRWLLCGDLLSKEDDIDVEKLVDHMRSGQTYDGGISESTTHEAHAGYTYCAIASFSLLNRLPDPSEAFSPISSPSSPTNDTSPGLTNFPATVRWLVSRQVGYSEDYEEDEDDESSTLPQQDQRDALAGIHKDAPESLSLNGLSLQANQFVGFNGRCNKRADTCYAFWVGASLDLVGHPQLVNLEAIRRFLLEQTQHRIGGFGKVPGDPPDIYHSYLGLAALGTMKEPGLKAFDPAFCISIEQRENIEKLRKEAFDRP